MERLELITDLRVLAREAAQRGEDRAAAILNEAAQVIYDDGPIVAKSRERRRADRERKPVKNPRIPRNSTESAESADGSSFSPTPPFPTPTPQHTTAREVTKAEREYDDATDFVSKLVEARMGDLWPTVDAFLLRRAYSTWKGFLDEMLTWLNATATPEDIAAVCRDDSTLTDRIGSGRGLRGFIRTAINERLQGARTAAVAGTRSAPRAAPQKVEYPDPPKNLAPVVFS